MIKEQNNIDSNHKNYMPIWKLSLYCLLTLNLYQFIWFYKSWKFVEFKKQKKLSAWGRSLTSFLPILVLIWPFLLFKDIYSVISKTTKLNVIFIATILTAFIGVTNCFAYENNQSKIIALFSFLPLLVVQFNLNKYINGVKRSYTERSQKFIAV